MKLCCSLFILLFSFVVYAQDKTPVHGEVFGKKPGKTAMVNAEKLEAYMDTKPRISTTIKGKVVNVVKEKGGWFTVDAGNGKVIAAHFKDYNVSIPAGLKGQTVIVEGVAQKQSALDSQQHLAGKKQPGDKTTNQLSFEATGLIVE
jgi:acyl-CoA-binding protein